MTVPPSSLPDPSAGSPESTKWLDETPSRRRRGPSRRSFLGGSALTAAGAAAGFAAGAGLQEYRIDTDIRHGGYAVGSYRPPGLTTNQIVYRMPTTRPVVALTFDDGPSTAYTSDVLNILDEEEVRATFFVIGEHVRARPELTKRAALRHEIGNHTWSHPNLAISDAPAVTKQLSRTAEEINDAAGVRPTVFRPPYGAFSGSTIMIATAMAYPVVMWDFEFDQHGPSAADNIARMTRLAQPGSVILGHDGGTLNCDVVVEALPRLISNLKARGFGFATVSELMAVPTAPNA